MPNHWEDQEMTDSFVSAPPKLLGYTCFDPWRCRVTLRYMPEHLAANENGIVEKDLIVPAPRPVVDISSFQPVGPPPDIAFEHFGQEVCSPAAEALRSRFSR